MMRISNVDYVAAKSMIPVVFIISFGHLGSTYVYSMEILFCSDIVEKIEILTDLELQYAIKDTYSCDKAILPDCCY